MRRRPRRLRTRLAAAAVAATAGWVLLLTIAFNALLVSQLEDQAYGILRQQASLAAATVVVDPTGLVRVDEAREPESVEGDLWVFAASSPGSGGPPAALEKPRAGTRLQREAARMAQGGPRHRVVGNTRPAELYALPVRREGHQVATVVTAVSLVPYRHAERLALLGSGALALLLLGGVFVTTSRLVRRALAPVAAMTEQAEQWSREGVAARFGPGPRPEELEDLAGHLDALLDRLAGLLRHEQQVTDDVSHELRTPLALITGEAELLLARGSLEPGLRTGVEAVLGAAGRMEAIIETLLTAARARAAGTTGRCSLLEVVQRVASDAADARVAVSGEGRDVTCGVDGAVVERILAPLVDNARRYADQRVELRVDPTATHPTLLVLDDGPGVPEELREAVFEPGRRLSDDGHPGAGLGLALSRRLARGAGGDVVAVRDGFAVQLPPG